ncbi:dihydropteroate synthase [Agrobacterium rosae]|uniref:dihydropteroate synthase n=1 Tax=Agrobacterium rosae TaxID=1972867 RepID=A0AAE5VNY8_9HYPH|nr:dihydropteroate synthase [Agrobacterium rosae]KAA3509926.1 dihydropteroate synthase [Agrobacterium rosae]KAA3515127.1 dihydropteroate synthase [Agrobacterium rosae]MCM2433137.1 dihydropteroate synthase [Agrobacterium rosae]MDX8331468.1 dihydropteroate synthase [Agrobacterium rosae]MQB50522.1 dihydropteroate synthase [Agrobacterium rosae]
MAIVNATPDSFSDGGRYLAADQAFSHALSCIEGGAHIIDIGGESTRPGAAVVSEQEEQDRVLPIIERLSAATDALISVDTYRASTAKLAVEAGAHIVNDVCGLQKDAGMAGVVAETGAGVCIMHTGRERQKLPDAIEDQFAFLNRSLDIAKHAGISRNAIMLDPGFGFAKDTDENILLMSRFDELSRFGLPILAGTSRKRFIGALTQQDEAEDRDVATAATTAILRLAGAIVFRVHNVAMTRDALAIADAVLRQKKNNGEGRS